ncbi:MAG: hypothetical protein KC619_30115 [Myxococcales bacterium]|nr:hypothetical protein [Myxococcales bacterium]
MGRWVIGMAVLLAGCGEAAGATDAGTTADAGGGAPSCPAAAPGEGDPCTTAASCGYLACDDVGVIRATCDGSTFHVSTEACAPVDCRDTTCEAGQICIINVGGAVIPLCTAPSDGPLTCETVCGGPCITVVDPPAAPPLRFQCNTCTSGMCP